MADDDLEHSARTAAGRLAAGLGQWPAVAALWSLYALAVLAVCLPVLAAAPVPLGQKLAVALFLAFALSAEGLALVLLNALLATAAGGARLGGLSDALRAAALVALVAVLSASLVKFQLTGVHLRSTDLWFLTRNLAQIGAEAQLFERRALGGLLVATLVAAAAAVAAFIRLRRRRPPWAAVRQGLVRLFLLQLVLTAGTAVCWAAYPTVSQFGRLYLPEARWIAGRVQAARRAAAQPAPGARGGANAPAPPGVTGAAIGAYRPGPPERAPNIVLVMLESVPWKRTGVGGGRAQATPNIDRLAGESLLFSRAYAASTHSDYAQMAILSSLYPRKTDEHDYYARIEYPRALLWDALRPAGYATSMFSCQNERWGNMLAFLDTPGLELVRHSLDWPRARHKGRGIESKVFEETPVGEWKRWRESGAPEPYFTYLNFQSNHFPYEVPPEAERPFAPHEIDFPASFLRYPREKVPVMHNRFDNALRHADRWIGEVRAFLEARGEWDRTVMIVVSDHGEAFYEHAEPTHGTSLYEEQVRSLLLVRLPGEPARRIDEPVSLMDLPPALLGWLGLPAHGNFQGRGDIFDAGYTARGRPLFFTIQGLTNEDGVLLDGWKYRVNWDRERALLHHLPSDPEERVDRLAERPDVAAKLERTLIDLLSRQQAYYRMRLWERGLYIAPVP